MIKVAFPLPPDILGFSVYNGWVFREGHSIEPNSRPFDHLTTRGGPPSFRADHRLCYLHE